jgi:hypothetical protein
MFYISWTKREAYIVKGVVLSYHSSAHGSYNTWESLNLQKSAWKFLNSSCLSFWLCSEIVSHKKGDFVESILFMSSILLELFEIR